jgi:hypothetical protein
MKQHFVIILDSDQEYSSEIIIEGLMTGFHNTEYEHCDVEVRPVKPARTQIFGTSDD